MTEETLKDRLRQEAAGELSVEYPVSEAERHRGDRDAFGFALFGVCLIVFFAWLTYRMFVWEWELLFALFMLLTLCLALIIGLFVRDTSPTLRYGRPADWPQRRPLLLARLKATAARAKKQLEGARETLEWRDSPAEEERLKDAKTRRRKYEDLWEALESDRERLRFLEEFQASDDSQVVAAVEALQGVLNEWRAEKIYQEKIRRPDPPLAVLMIANRAVYTRSVDEHIDLIREDIRDPTRSLILEARVLSDSIRALEKAKAEALEGVPAGSQAYHIITKTFHDRIALLGGAGSGPVAEGTELGRQDGVIGKAKAARIAALQAAKEEATAGMDRTSEEYKLTENLFNARIGAVMEE